VEVFEALVYAEVYLPLALPGSLTYAFPASDAPVPGARVVVPLRGSKLYTGFVWKTRLEKPGDYQPRSIAELIDREEPYLNEKRRKFLEWMAAYYCCTLGEVLLAAVPAAHRLSSESQVQLHPDFSRDPGNEDDEEFRFFQLLQKKDKIPLSDLIKAFGSGPKWLKKIRQFQADGKILVLDEMVAFYKPKSRYFLCLAAKYCSDEALDALFLKLEKKPEEEALMLKFLQKTRFTGNASEAKWELPKEDFTEDEQEKKILLRMQKRGIFILEKRRLEAFPDGLREEYSAPELSEEQSQALADIRQGFSEHKTCLLMGVTGSGKTEIYIHLIAEKIKAGKQCLLMLPEIAITVQIVSRLRRVFGGNMGVYHSRASLQEKMDVWEGIQSGRLQLVVGVRSAVFLPFRNPGLVVVDEEHDASYKQAEPSPRYHGRDAAIYLASLFDASVLLGSATPSVESHYKAKTGKWKFIRLTKRYGDSKLPEIGFADMRLAARMLRIRLDMAEDVLEEFRKTKEAGRQSILFQNRRGYAPFMECQDCGWVPYCPSCDVSLTLHQSKKTMNCHYCGHFTEMIKHCHSCGSVKILAQGYGTEKLEESLEQLLPGFRIARMDQDSTQSRRAFENLLQGMASGNTDILVGTQMVTKGLDFENVTFVAVFDVDRMLHYPDFRANERTFQLLSQIAGRAGRRTTKGKVLIQTRNPFHPVLKLVAENNASDFYRQETEHRQNFGFPPFSRLIRITARHREEARTLSAARQLESALARSLNPAWLSGPETPVIPRLRNQYIFHISLKIPEGNSLSFVKTVILENIRWMEGKKDHPGVQWLVDVDPV
jgi:primosomal protein N' (replication factor Y)